MTAVLRIEFTLNPILLPSDCCNNLTKLASCYLLSTLMYHFQFWLVLSHHNAAALQRELKFSVPQLEHTIEYLPCVLFVAPHSVCCYPLCLLLSTLFVAIHSVCCYPLCLLLLAWAILAQALSCAPVRGDEPGYEARAIVSRTLLWEL